MIEKRSFSIDTLKFFLAFLVVCIHCAPPFNIDVVYRVAVPCFFIISGFFTYNAIEDNRNQKLLYAINKISKITLWSTILFTVMNYSIGVPERDLSCIEVLKDLFSFIFFNNPSILVGKFGGPLWYLYAYIYVLIFALLIFKYKLEKYVYYVIPIILTTGLLFGIYSFVLFDNFKLPPTLARNFFFVGIPYFFIGILIKKYYKVLFPNCILFILAP